MSCHVILVIAVLSLSVVVLSSNHINYVETDLVNSNEMADCLFLRILRVKMSLRNSIFKTCRVLYKREPSRKLSLSSYEVKKKTEDSMTMSFLIKNII